KALAAEDAREAPDASATDPKVADATATDAEEPGPEATASEEGRAPSRRGPDYSVPSSIDLVADPVLYAMSTRRSISKVDPETPICPRSSAPCPRSPTTRGCGPGASSSSAETTDTASVPPSTRPPGRSADPAKSTRSPCGQSSCSRSCPHRPSMRKSPSGSSTPPPPEPDTCSNSPCGKPVGR